MAITKDIAYAVQVHQQQNVMVQIFPISFVSWRMV